MDYNIVCHGNSITLGSTQTPYPSQLDALLSAGSVVINKGYGGQTTQYLYDNFESQVNSSFDASKINIVIMWEATNYFTTLEWSVAEEYALQQAYTLLAQSKGWLVILANIIQRGNGINLVTWREKLTAFNSAMIGCDRSFCDGFLDIWSLDTDFQGEFTGVGPVASYIDEAHLNTARYGDIAADALLELPVATGEEIGLDINGTRTRVWAAYEGKTFSLDGVNYYKDNVGIGDNVAPIGLTSY